MATELDKLVVKIEADLSNLKKGMAQANKVVSNSSSKMSGNLTKFSNSLAKVTATATKVGAVLAVAFGAIFVKGVVDVGIQIENLKVRLEALFGSAREGEKAFEKMLEFAGKVPFTLGEIQQASGNLAVVSKDADELAEILKITGNVAAVTGLDFRQTGEQIQRSFSGGIASADVFRERGVRSLLGFKAGAEVTVEETIAKFKEVFGEGGEFGKMTDELANTLTGTVSMIKDKFMQFQIAVGESFFAELKKQFKDLDGFLNKNNQSIKELGKTVGENLAKTVRFLVENISGIKNFFIAFAGISVINMLARLKNSFIALNLVMLLNPIMLAITVGVGASAGIIAIIEYFKDLNNVAKDVTESLKKQNEQFRESQGMLEQFMRRPKAVQDAFYMANPDIDPKRKEIDDKRKEDAKRIAEQSESMRKLIENNTMMAQGQGLLQVALSKTKDEMTDYQQVMNGVADVFDNAGKAISKTFADALIKGESFRQGMLDIFQSIISQIIELIIQIKLIEPFMENLGDVLRGTNTAKTTSGGSAIGGQILGDLINKGFDLIGLAGGGSVNPNMPYMVGERGAEMFVPKSAGNIVNNNNLPNMSGGQPIVIEQNLNFATGVSQTVRAEVMNLLPAIQQSTLSAVQDARLRGGSFAKDFGG